MHVINVICDIALNFPLNVGVSIIQLCKLIPSNVVLMSQCMSHAHKSVPLKGCHVINDIHTLQLGFLFSDYLFSKYAAC